jgi:hypothetical protein
MNYKKKSCSCSGVVSSWSAGNLGDSTRDPLVEKIGARPVAMAFSKRDLEVQCSCWQRCGGAGAQPAAAVIVAAVYVVPRERKEGRYRKGGAFYIDPGSLLYYCVGSM